MEGIKYVDKSPFLHAKVRRLLIWTEQYSGLPNANRQLGGRFQ